MSMKMKRRPAQGPGRTIVLPCARRPSTIAFWNTALPCRDAERQLPRERSQYNESYDVSIQGGQGVCVKDED